MNGEIRREAAVMTAVWAGLSAAGILLYRAGVISFLLVHTVAEFISILAASALALLAWNARRYLDNGALRVIGAGYLFVAFLDLLHTLSFQGIHLFENSGESLSMKLWLSASAVQAGALLVAPSFSRTKPNMRAALALFGTITILFLIVIFSVPVFPEVRLPNGLDTGFASASEVLIVAALCLSLVRFHRQRALFGAIVYTWLVGSIVLSIFAVGLVSITPGDTNLTDMLGDFLKVSSFYLIYKAVIETGFTRPMEILFSDLLKNRASLQRERDFINGVLETASAMVLVTDAQGRVVRINRALQEITGARMEDVEGRYIWETNIFPGSQEEIHRFFLEQLSSRPSNNFEQRIISAEGEAVEVTWTTGVQYSQEGVPRFVIGTGIDISDRKKVENELRYLSSHDILTGLFNRAHFESEMLRLADSEEFPVSIVIADLDGLKHVNDTEGHIMGDKIIQRAAHILRSAFRAEDIIARIGGDEFGVLLPRADAAVANNGARRVRSILAAYNQINNEHPLSLSVGYATCAAGYQLMEAFKKADSAMYNEKGKTRDAVGGD